MVSAKDGFVATVDRERTSLTQAPDDSNNVWVSGTNLVWGGGRIAGGQANASTDTIADRTQIVDT